MADPNLSALQQLSNSTSQLVEDFTPIEYSEMSTIPTTGSANYAGYLAMEFANTEDTVTDTIIGELSLVVSFDAADLVEGIVFGLLDENGAPLTGTIELSGGDIDRLGDPAVDATFSFDGSGNLMDIQDQTIELELIFEGDFLGQAGVGVGGDVFGYAAINGEQQVVGGLFIASQ